MVSSVGLSLDGPFSEPVPPFGFKPVNLLRLSSLSLIERLIGAVNTLANSCASVLESRIWLGH